MSTPSDRNFRPKAWTWLERDAQPDSPHETIDPQAGVVLPGGPDEEGRFVVRRETENGEQTRWVGDRRHWTEIPPKME
jgi:hypothetical protein